jgi:hypothetical protein
MWGQTSLSKTPTTVVSINTNTSTTVQATEPNLSTLRSELEGTFAVEVNRANYQVLYTIDLLEAIQAHRKVTETVRLTWDAYTTIVIFPLQHSTAPISTTPKSE